MLMAVILKVTRKMLRDVEFMLMAVISKVTRKMLRDSGDGLALLFHTVTLKFSFLKDGIAYSCILN
jgi:hypothetical protein